MATIDTLAGPVQAGPIPDDAELDALRSWVPAQRWFPAKGSDSRLRRVAAADLTDPLGEAVVRVHLLATPGGVVLQVPTTLRPGANPGTGDGAATAGLIAPVPGGLLVDGPHDPAFVRAWLAAAHDAGAAPTRIGRPRVVGGEQSNTSVLLPEADRPSILKVFRIVTPGPNPDVEVPLALAQTGWTGVPRPLAWLPGAWAEAGDAGAVGHLGVLSELVQGAHDGFELACEYARTGVAFDALAEDLGRTTAQMHRALRSAIPAACGPTGRTAADRRAEVHRVVRTLRERADAAARRVPALAARIAAVHAAYDRLEVVPAVPPLQRVHGDYHLGQVLRSGDASDGHWYVLDFEGEPQASAEEKTRPDLALRDLAGMLRSLDYAAAVGGADDPAWLADARMRLIAGYERDSDGSGGPDVILPSLELDKAIYEVVYESGNRPSWTPIPLAGVDRLLAGIA